MVTPADHTSALHSCAERNDQDSADVDGYWIRPQSRSLVHDAVPFVLAVTAAAWTRVNPHQTWPWV